MALSISHLQDFKERSKLPLSLRVYDRHLCNVLHSKLNYNSDLEGTGYSDVCMAVLSYLVFDLIHKQSVSVIFLKAKSLMSGVVA